MDHELVAVVTPLPEPSKSESKPSVTRPICGTADMSTVVGSVCSFMSMSVELFVVESFVMSVELFVVGSFVMSVVLSLVEVGPLPLIAAPTKTQRDQEGRTGEYPGHRQGASGTA